MPSNLPKQIEKSVANFTAVVESEMAAWTAARDPAAFRAMELAVAAHGRELADEITAHVLRAATRDPALQAETSAAARRAYPGGYRHGGRRTVKVTLLGGKQVTLEVEYLKANRRASPRKRRNGNRGKSGTGLYPVLAALGIWFGVTPAVAGEVCRQVADSDSVRTGRSALARRGIVIGHGRTLRIVNQTSQRAVEQRQRWLARARDAEARSGPLAHKRVVVAVNGGRIRERVPARNGRRRAATGHRGYGTPWREPKQLVIYVIDSRTGAVDDSFCPVYAATLGDCEVIFDMLAGYLKALGAHEASRLIVVGDGAPWIWERAKTLAETIGLPTRKLVEAVNCYHAVEKLHAIADVPRCSQDQRDRWVTRAKTALHKGDTDRVVELIDELAVGRRAKQVATHRDYFVRNHHRMQYAAFKRQHLPLGSGAVESAVRRVINQRLKACGTFWLEDSAEGMLLLRSYLKCGRFDDLIDWSLASAAAWWPAATHARDLDRGPLLHAENINA